VKWIINEIKEMRVGFKEDIANVIESQNGKNNMLDCRITGVNDEVKIIKKDQNEIKIKQAVSTTKLTAVIAGITFILTMVSQALFDTCTEILKK
jgi:hypothetical protein